MNIFNKIVIQCKSETDNDWRAFLHFLNTDENMIYEIRGYGESAGKAADCAMSYFTRDDDPSYYAEDNWSATEETA